MAIKTAEATVRTELRAAHSSLTLPTDRHRLEEINLPDKLIDSLLGKTVMVEATPETPAGTHRFDELPSDLPLLIDRNGIMWNDYWPMRVVYKEAGRDWHFPRYWLTNGCKKYQNEFRYDVTKPVSWTKQIHLPTEWDMRDVNIDARSAHDFHGKPCLIEVSVTPDSPVQVYWKSSTGRFRLPSNWRRRRVKLPPSAILMDNGIPEEIAEEFSGKSVSVNYHPGSLCCLPGEYRFRDGHGSKWPVRITNCLLLGYGDQDEKIA